MMFHIGQKVVCIGSYTNVARVYSVNVPLKDKIYTVRDIERRDQRTGIRLEEIYNHPVTHDCGTFCEPAFWIEDFRPLIERGTETGMAILRKILDDVKHKEPV